MPVIPVEDWVPDAAALGNRGALRIVNALPGITSYVPVRGLRALTDALDNRPRGAIEARDNAGNVFQFAGDETKLYQLIGTSWTDVSDTYGYQAGQEEIWEFVRWGDKILATNFDDDPQEITMGGVSFGEMTSQFRCRRLAVVRDYVVAGSTFDQDGEVRDRVRWSPDENDWTPDDSTGADVRDLNVGGAIQRIIGGQYGVIVSERSTFRMSWAGAPVWFQIDEVLPGIGAISPGAVARLGDTVFIASEHGFIAVTNGASSVPIGAGKVDDWFRRDLDESYAYRMSSSVDPRNGRVFWAYPGSGNAGGAPNRIILYDRKLDKWGLIELDLELIWRAGGVGFTMDQLDNVTTNLDELGVSLDSSRWKGTSNNLSAFGANFMSGMFDGPQMEALVETKEVEIYSGHSTQINAVRPLVDGGSVKVRIGRRRTQSDEVSWGPELTPTETGRCTGRSNGRYHRFQLLLSDAWEDAIGVSVDRSDARKAGRRG